jgi:osmoprotectant transport system ATP-binding protein
LTEKVKKSVNPPPQGYKVAQVPAAKASEQSQGGASSVSFRGATKRYGDSTVPPAVDHLDLEVDAGEICVLVGPSGCGKTTSMRMVNRMIELSEGDILIDGESVMSKDAAKLRREIGYVIQQIGLFPHRTIAQNIATVPQLLGWDKDRIRTRTTELLDLVGLDPEFGDRYPVQLSGGQQQRVGVARALAVDPPVMLMDEPFGAIDPIARERLQNEFLRLQANIQKTILFVTHDIDEAIKMGDRIAIMKQHGRVEQYATPAEILMAPANDFVEDFVGADRALKRLSLMRVGDVNLWRAPNARPGQSTAEVRAELDHPDVEVPYALLVDDGERPLGWLTERDLAGDTVPDKADAPLGPVLETRDVMRDALADLLQGESMYAAVVDGDRRITGILSVEIISEFLASPQAKTDEHSAVERPLGAERESEIAADE